MVATTSGVAPVTAPSACTSASPARHEAARTRASSDSLIAIRSGFRLVLRAAGVGRSFAGRTGSTNVPRKAVARTALMNQATTAAVGARCPQAPERAHCHRAFWAATASSRGAHRHGYAAPRRCPCARSGFAGRPGQPLPPQTARDRPRDAAGLQRAVCSSAPLAVPRRHHRHDDHDRRGGVGQELGRARTGDDGEASTRRGTDEH
jgi:hypothetical protein